MKNHLDGKVTQVAEFQKASDGADDQTLSCRMHGICMAAIIDADSG